MKKIAAIAVSAAAMTGLFAAPSALAAGGELCYDVNVNVNGQVIAQSGCQPIG